MVPASQAMSLLWPLFSWSAWAQAATVVVARKLKALLWPLFDRSAWAQPATVVAGTRFEGTDVDSVRSVSVGSARHYGGGHDW